VKAALAKEVPERSRKSVTTGQPAAPKAQRAGPSAEQMDLGEGRNHIVRGGLVVKATTTPPPNPHPNPPPQVTKAPEQPKVTATGETARPQKPEPKSTAAPKQTAGKSKKKAAVSVKTAAAKLTPPNLVVPTQNINSPLEEISDLLEHLPLPACVELTRWLLTFISSLPIRAARPWAVLKTVIVFVAKYGSTP
jgi:hypothetical protein